MRTILHEMDRRFAMRFLSRPEVSSFWGEIGAPVELPESYRFLYAKGVGLFVLEPLEKCIGIHVAILPKSRGIHAIKAGRAAIRFGVSLSGKVLARIRKSQPETWHFAALCGMRRYSENETHVFYEATLCP